MIGLRGFLSMSARACSKRNRKMYWCGASPHKFRKMRVSWRKPMPACMESSSAWSGWLMLLLMNALVRSKMRFFRSWLVSLGCAFFAKTQTESSVSAIRALSSEEQIACVKGVGLGRTSKSMSCCRWEVSVGLSMGLCLFLSE